MLQLMSSPTKQLRPFVPYAVVVCKQRSHGGLDALGKFAHPRPQNPPRLIDSRRSSTCLGFKILRACRALGLLRL